MKRNVVFRGQNYVPLRCLENDDYIIFEAYTRGILGALLRYNLYGAYVMVAILTVIWVFVIPVQLANFVISTISSLDNSVGSRIVFGSAIFLFLIPTILLNLPQKAYGVIKRGIDQLLFLFPPGFIDVFPKNYNIELIQLFDNIDQRFYRITPLKDVKSVTKQAHYERSSIDEVISHYSIIVQTKDKNKFRLGNMDFRQNEARVPEKEINAILTKMEQAVKVDYAIKEVPDMSLAKYVEWYDRKLIKTNSNAISKMEAFFKRRNVIVLIIIAITFLLALLVIYLIFSYYSFLMLYNFVTKSYRNWFDWIIVFPVSIVLVNISVSLAILGYIELVIRSPAVEVDD